MAKSNYEDTNVASIIAAGCTFDGSISVKGSIRVDGEFKGKLQVSETLVVGKSGKLDAEVETQRAAIAGNLKGEINAVDGVKLQAGSHFEGNIYTKNLVIEEGVYFDGGCWRSVESRKSVQGSGGKPVSQKPAGSPAPSSKDSRKETAPAS